MKTLLFILVVALSGGAVGQNWYQLSVPTTNKLLAIDFPSSSVGYIVGEDTTILKTTDGGQTWNQLPANGIQTQSFAQTITDVKFVNELTGFIAVGYSGVYKTIDGGQSWTFLSGQTSNMCFPQAIYPFSETNGFVGGGGCFEGAIVDAFNAGAWTTTTSPGLFWDSEQKVQDIDFVNANVGLVAVKNQYMLRTTNGGQTWDTIPTGIALPGYLTSVVMVNDTLCYAGYGEVNTNGFGVLKSVDAGLTWTQDINSATFFYPDYFCVAAATNGAIYAGGKPSNTPGGLIFKTNLTATTTWDYATVDQPIHDMDSYGSDVTFGVGDSGYVVVNVPPGNLGHQETALALSVVLYPNPVHTQLTIESAFNILAVRVFNVDGKEVKVNFLNGKKVLDVSMLASGMYTVMIQTEKGSAVERMCVE